MTERRDEDEDVVRAFFDRSQTLKWESGGDSRTGSIDRSISRCIWFFFRARAPAERGVSLCDWRFVNRRLHPSRGPSVQTETKVGGFETTVDCDFFFENDARDVGRMDTGVGALLTPAAADES